MLPPEELDAILTYQLAVAWAGESGDDEPRLGWWETDMVSKYGGLALFEQLTPRSAHWAALEAAREAARRVDDKARSKDADPDRLLSLFRLGAALDEHLYHRLLEHKRAGRPLHDALPRLGRLLTAFGAAGDEHGGPPRSTWERDAFAAWAKQGDKPNVVNEPSGRRLTGSPPADPVEVVRRLGHALLPLPAAYPFPHYRDA
jgi:hypothetical protein